MTFQEWQKTQTVHTDFDWASQCFGELPTDWPFNGEAVRVYEYDPGVMVELKDGTFYSAIDRGDYRGIMEDIEMRLWNEFARFECEE